MKKEATAVRQFRQLLKKYDSLHCYCVVDETSLYVVCKTCSVVGDTMYCVNCFLNGDHTGHAWYIASDIEGVCDCGDITAVRSGCRKHYLLWSKDYWSKLTEPYSAEDLTKLLKLMKTNSQNPVFLKHFADEKHHLLPELLVLGRYCFEYPDDLHDFDAVIRKMLSSDLRGMLQDIFYLNEMYPIAIGSVIVKCLFFPAINYNFDLVTGVKSDFFKSLTICQLISCPSGYKYLREPKAGVFVKLIDLLRSAVSNRTTIETYDYLFYVQLGRQQYHQQMVYDSITFLKSFSLFYSTLTSWQISPEDQYQNYEEYFNGFLEQDGKYEKCIWQFYGLVSQVSATYHDVSFYAKLIADLFEYQRRMDLFKSKEKKYYHYPPYMVYAYFLQVAKTCSVGFGDLLSAVVACLPKTSAKQFLQTTLWSYCNTFWFMFSLDWTFFPRNHEDNRSICYHLQSSFHIVYLHDVMSYFCVQSLLTIGGDATEFLSSILPSRFQKSVYAVMLYFIMLATFPYFGEQKQVEQFVFRTFCTDEKFELEIGLLAEMISRYQHTDFTYVLERCCTRTFADYRSCQYQLTNFEDLNIFTFVDGHTQTIINYSIMRGATELLPCLAHYRERASQQNISTIRATTNVRRLIDHIISNPDPHYDLYTYISVAIANDLYCDKDSTVEAKILKLCNDDHIRLFLNKTGVKENAHSKLTVRERMGLLKKRISEPASETSGLLLAENTVATSSVLPTHEQEICCQCHQPLNSGLTICLYDHYIGLLNLVSLPLLRTCRHKFHRECLPSKLNCPVCSKDNVFFLYHTDSEITGKNHFDDDTLMLQLVEHEQIEFQGIYSKMLKILALYPRFVFCDYEYARMCQFLKDQVYIMRYLALQRLISVDDAHKFLLADSFNSGAYFQAQFAAHKRNNTYIKLLKNLPYDSLTVLRVLTNEKCWFCGDFLTTRKPSAQCLHCGCYFHITCLVRNVECPECHAKTYHINFKEMLVQNLMVALALRAPYRTQMGDIPEGLCGESLYLDEKMRSFLSYNLVTGDIYMQQQENDMVIGLEADSHELY